MSVSVTDVCNLALGKVGSKPISAITDSSPQARALNNVYAIVRQSELRKNVWNFAIARTQLSADSPAPDWGRQNSFTLPSDFLRLADPYPETLTNDINVVGVTVAFTAMFTGLRDWVIEGRTIVTNDQAPLNVRYVYDVTDTSLWDALFVQVMGASLAYEICEILNQSNTKKETLAAEYKDRISQAKLANSIEIAPADPPPDTWLSARS